MPRSTPLFAFICLTGCVAAQTIEETCDNRSNTNVTREDCIAMPSYAEAFAYDTRDLTWKRYEVTSSSGYISSMARITGDSNN